MTVAGFRYTIGVSTALTVLFAASHGFAQTARTVATNANASVAAEADDAADTGNGEAIVVTGTHDPTMKARDSVSPITVVSAQQLAATGQADLASALVQLSPSITMPRIGNGAGNMVQKLNLRTLTSNQTLVLVNGKRRHSTAVVTDTAGEENGTTPVDLGMIPVSAIDHVEILEDGAAALYGSDAIAGVINIILKTNRHGLQLETLDGGYYAGDGFSSRETLNWGTSLFGRGFFNLSAEYHHQSHTNRSGTDTRVNKDVAKYFGLPSEDKVALSYNAAYNISDQIQAYSFSTYAYRHAGSYQNYRVPSEAPDLIPNGLNPLLQDSENDFSITGGLKGDFGGWHIDLSSTYGEDHNSYNLHDSINQSLYKATGTSPLNFYVGNYSDSQWTNDLQIRREFDLGFFASPLNVTVGGQYRRDGYSVGEGDANSYYGAGTDGFSGLNPSSVVNAHRNVEAAYLDLAVQPVKHWQVDLSGRYEHYSYSGHVWTGKVSSRYDFNRFVAIRGTISNGFRAPTLGEQYYTRIGVTSRGASGTLAYNSPGGKLLNAPALKPERSMSYSASVLVNPMRNFHITVDAYQITINDRIVAAGTANGQTAIDALAAQGIAVNSSATASAVQISYFTNAANTRTRGLDVTANYRVNLGPHDAIDLDASANVNKTDVLKVNNDLAGDSLLNTQTRAYISSYFPRSKIVFGGVWHHNKLDVNLHLIRWGQSITQRQYYYGQYANSITNFYRFYNEPRWQTNLELDYQFTKRLRASLGANNLFNVYPNRAPASTVFAGVANYEQVGQGLGYQGGYYYASLRFTL